tara:strand:- start:7 stop:222 length:216 start_codon:yes stop_codon:yes gene_type:complete
LGNYSEAHDKIVVHLQEVYKKHRALDNEVLELEKTFVDNYVVRRLKTKKLWLKDEIHRLESELKLLGNGNL